MVWIRRCLVATWLSSFASSEARSLGAHGDHIIGQVQLVGDAKLQKLVNDVLHKSASNQKLVPDELSVVEKVLEILGDKSETELKKEAEDVQRQVDDACSAGATSLMELSQINAQSNNPCDGVLKKALDGLGGLTSTVTEQRAAHVECRNSIPDLESANETAWKEFEDFIESLKKPEDSVDPETGTSVCAMPEEPGALLEALKKKESWAEANLEHYTQLQETYDQANSHLEEERPACSQKQQSFQDSYCDLIIAAGTAGKYDKTCRTETGKGCSAVEAEADVAMESLSDQFGDMGLAICYLRALKVNDSPNLKPKLDKCTDDYKDKDHKFKVHRPAESLMQGRGPLDDLVDITDPKFAEREYGSLKTPADPVTGSCADTSSHSSI